MKKPGFRINSQNQHLQAVESELQSKPIYSLIERAP